jgi:seryl-tRNA synthetase
MLDIRFIRENTELVQEKAKQKATMLILISLPALINNAQKYYKR